MTDQFDSAANDLLQYPKSFHEFLAVVDLFGRAREIVQKPGEGFNEALLRTTSEIDAALAIFREVWANADAGRAAPSTPENAGGGAANRAACEVERDAAKCWREPCAAADACTAPIAGVLVGASVSSPVNKLNGNTAPGVTVDIPFGPDVPTAPYWTEAAAGVQAPAALRLPEPRQLPKMDASYSSNSTYFRGLGWNECLGEVKRLNADGAQEAVSQTLPPLGTDGGTPQ